MSKGRKKGSGNGVSKTLTISLSPEQRVFLSRKLADTGATLAGYIRALLDSSDGKRSEIIVPESPSITITPAQRDFLSRKLEGTGATMAGYIRVLIDGDISKEQETGMENETKEIIELFGRITKIRHRKKSILKDRDWAVFDLATTSQLINCTGTLPDIATEGVEIWTTGEYVESEWGKQVKCRKIIAAAPDTSTAEGVVRLLMALPGIGQARAWRAVNKYGHYKAWMLAKTDPGMIEVGPHDCVDAMRIANSLEYDYAAKKLLVDELVKREIKK